MKQNDNTELKLNLTHSTKQKSTFFNCYLAVPRSTLDHSRRDSLTNPMLITAFVQFRHKGNREPCNEVGSLSPAERLVEFEPGAFQFLSQRLNTLGHSPHLESKSCQSSNTKLLPTSIYTLKFNNLNTKKR